MQIHFMIIGILLLTLGRKLFWLFVGLAGFVAGMQAAQLYFSFESAWGGLIIGLLCGLLGVVLALLFQNLAIGLGGFAAGSAIAAQLTVMLGLSPVVWITLCGGIGGVILFLLFFDWALMVLSSLAGAGLILQHAAVSARIAPWLFAGLTIAGILIQNLLSRPQSSKRPNRNEQNRFKA